MPLNPIDAHLVDTMCDLITFAEEAGYTIAELALFLAKYEHYLVETQPTVQLTGGEISRESARIWGGIADDHNMELAPTWEDVRRSVIALKEGR